MKRFSLTNQIVAVCLSAALVGCSQPAPSKTPLRVSPSSTPLAGPSSVTPTPEAVSEESTSIMQEAGVQFTVPAGWKCTERSSGIALTPADESCAIVLLVPPEQDPDKLGEKVDAFLQKLMTDIKVEGEGEHSEVNGLKAFTLEGSGTSDGQALDWTVQFVQADKLLMVLAYGESERIEKNADGIVTVFGSFRKTREE